MQVPSRFVHFSSVCTLCIGLAALASSCSDTAVEAVPDIATSAQSQSALLSDFVSDTGVCDLDDVTNPQICEGPWVFSLYPRCELPCGEPVCTAHKTVNDSQFESPPHNKPRLATTLSGIALISLGTREDRSKSVAKSVDLVPAYGWPAWCSEITDVVQAKANREMGLWRVLYLHKNGEMTGGLANSAFPVLPESRVTHWDDDWSYTGSRLGVDGDPVGSPQCKKIESWWFDTWECERFAICRYSRTVYYPPEGEVCSSYSQPTCQVRSSECPGPVEEIVTMFGKSSSVLPSSYDWPPVDGTLHCTTCDDVSGSPEQRLACLEKWYVWGVQRPDWVVRNRIEQKATILYELTGVRSSSIPFVHKDLCGPQYLQDSLTDPCRELEWTLEERVFDLHTRMADFTAGHLRSETLSEFFFTLASDSAPVNTDLQQDVDSACLEAIALQRRDLLGALINRRIELLQTDLKDASQKQRDVLLADYLNDLNAWQQANIAAASLQPVDGGKASATALDAALSSFWKVLESVYVPNDVAQALRGALGSASSVLYRALDDYNHARTEMFQAVLRAVYNPSVTLSDALAVDLTAAALEPLEERLASLTSYHDLGCAVRDCAGAGIGTPISRLWGLLARLDVRDGDDALANYVAGLPDDAGGWKSTFEQMVANQTRLTSALATLLGEQTYVPHMLAVAASSHSGIMTLQRIVSTARTLSTRYQATGLLGAQTGFIRSEDLTFEGRARIADAVQDAVRQFYDHKQALDANLGALVRDIVTLRDQESVIEGLELQIDNERDDYLRVMDRRDAYVGLQQDDNLADLVAASLSASEPGQRASDDFTITDWPLRNIAGTDGRFVKGDTDITGLSFLDPIDMKAGEVLSVRVSGDYAPTCALRLAGFASDDEMRQQVNTAVTGPEGFAIDTVESKWVLQQSSETHTRRTADASGGGGALGVGIPGVGGPSFTGSHERSDIYESTETTGQGTETRSMASFRSGLMVPEFTPLGDVAVGSLVVVEMPTDSVKLSDRLDVYPIRRGDNAVVASRDSRFYLVVNDHVCAETAASPKLDLTLRKMASASEVSHQLTGRVAAVLEWVRAQRPAIMKRGEMLPSESQALQAEAYSMAIVADVATGPVIVFEDYPPVLKTIFVAFLSQQTLGLEAAARVVSLDHELSLKERDILDLQQRIDKAKDNYEILKYLPGLTARSVDLGRLRSAADAVASSFLESFLVVTERWAPQVMATHRRASTDAPDSRSAQMQQSLLALTVESSLHDAIGPFGDLVALLMDDYGRAYGLGEIAQPEVARVALSVRNPLWAALAGARPESLDAGFPALFDESYGFYRYPTVSAQRATAFWCGAMPTAPLCQDPQLGTLGRVSIQPEDIYAAGDVTMAQLGCEQQLPIVRAMQALVVRTEDVDSFLMFNEEPLDLKLQGSGQMLLPATTGLWRHGVAVRRVTTPLVYSDGVTSAFRAVDEAGPLKAQSTDGFSPLTSLSVDLASIPTLQLGLDEGTRELVLVMELEVQPSVDNSRVSGVAACSR